MKIAEYIIGNIDDDGYLRRDLEAIADDLIFQAGQEVTIDQVKGVLLVIQDLEPVGVAARNLQECLLIQLEKGNKNSDCQLAIRVLKEYFDEFTRKHYDKIVRGLQVDEESLKKQFTKSHPLIRNPEQRGATVWTPYLVRLSPIF